jgi:hypothetical protein
VLLLKGANRSFLRPFFKKDGFLKEEVKANLENKILQCRIKERAKNYFSFIEIRIEQKK